LIWKIYAAADEFHTVGNLVLSRNFSSNDNTHKSESVGKVIHVHNRRTGQLEEEKIPHYVELALRIMYSTKSGQFAVQSKKVKKVLKHLTIVQGKKYDDPRSKKEIEAFVKFHVCYFNRVNV
jgi:phosphatidylserine decarboxylase